MKKFISIFILTVLSKALFAQCTTLGQTPSTAFPVCGLEPFIQKEVPTCRNSEIPVSACNDGVPYGDANPYWYKFVCYQSGSLDFTVTPNNLDDDYDWELFDVTGVDPNDVYSNSSLAVAANWSGNSSLESARGYTGVTGTSSSAANTFVCASNPQELGGFPPFSDAPTLSTSPNIVVGHTYLLMVSHYSGDNQSGYTLAFTGGSASITDPLTPAVLSVEASCDGEQLKVKLNKQMKCSSIAANGSDFKVLGPVKTTSAVGVGCSIGFETDSVILDLNQSILPGNATLVVVTGTDSTTLLDNCDNEIPDSSATDFRVFERVPTPFDSILPVNCAPKGIQLAFNKNILCNSIAPDGSDFYMTGTYPVNIIAAEGRCANDVTKIINITFDKPLTLAGTFTINLKTGSDGNTLIDECKSETPVPQTLSFTIKDTVSARYDYHITENCTNDIIDLITAGGNGITQWTWLVDGTPVSRTQNTTLTYSSYGNRTIQLAVTNEFCTDTVTHVIDFPHDTLEARFSGPTLYCPNDIAIFKDSSRGNITAWTWQFGNGHTSNLQEPPSQTYHTTQPEQLFPVSLVVQNTRNCFDTAISYIKVTKSCYIAVPSGFTPNGDGVNDYLYPLNAYKATSLLFSVYNKHGQKIFETKDWTRKWDGTYNSHPQPSDVYVWMLQYKDETGKSVFLKGTTVLIR